MYININLDATAVNNKAKMNFTNDTAFGGNPLLTPVGRLEVVAAPANLNMRPTLGGGMQHIPGAFMFHPASGTGQFMLEDGSFTFNSKHESIMEGTCGQLIEALKNSFKVTEDTVVTVVPFGGPSVMGTDVNVRFIPSPERAVEFEKFKEGWRVWDVTDRVWQEFMVVFDLDGVFSLNTPPEFVTLHLGRGDVVLYLDKSGRVQAIDTPDDVDKFGIQPNNEIFQYLKVGIR